TAAERSTGPPLHALVPSGMVAAGGGLSAGQLLGIADRLTKAETAVKTANDRHAAETKKLNDSHAASLKLLTDSYNENVKRLTDTNAANMKLLAASCSRRSCPSAASR